MSAIFIYLFFYFLFYFFTFYFIRFIRILTPRPHYRGSLFLIMQIEILNEDYIAGIDRQNDILYLGDTFFKLPAGVQRYIIQHELGHRNLDTSNETLADEYAIKHFIGTEKQSLKKAYDAINIIPDSDTFNIYRKNNALRLLLEIDCKNFNNSKACKMLYSQNTDNFLGICTRGSRNYDKCVADREARKNNRQNKRDARFENKDQNRDAWNAMLAAMANRTNNANRTSKDKTNSQNFGTPNPNTGNKKTLIIVIIAVVLISVIALLLKN